MRSGRIKAAPGMRQHRPEPDPIALARRRRAMSEPTRICSIDGCENPHRARGWCAAHYSRWQKHGDPNLGRTTAATCSVDGCENPPLSRGWCEAHYRRWRRYGDPLSGGPLRESKPRAQIVVFDDRVQPADGGCLAWTGPVDRQGYGKHSVGGTYIQAHRYAWERANGPIPDGMLVDHVCHNASCVNVEHLRLVTRAQNGANRRGAASCSKSGIRNVARAGGKWEVRVTINGQRRYFGAYLTVEEATEVAARTRRELFGDYAGLG